MVDDTGARHISSKTRWGIQRISKKSSKFRTLKRNSHTQCILLGKQFLGTMLFRWILYGFSSVREEIRFYYYYNNNFIPSRKSIKYKFNLIIVPGNTPGRCTKKTEMKYKRKRTNDECFCTFSTNILHDFVGRRESIFFEIKSISFL